MKTTMLAIKNLSYSYITHHPVFTDVSFTVKKGQVCALFGPNGCGKTTLFKCCLRFLPTYQGTIHINDMDIATLSNHELSKQASYVPQEHKPSFPYLVKDVVLMGRSPHMTNLITLSKHDHLTTIDALRLVGIEHLADTPYNQLSGGQRQLVIIARAVAQQAHVMYLDEPTSALDFHNQLMVWQLLRTIASSGTTVIACTHDPNHVLWFCDDVVIMAHQHIIAQGPPSKVITNDTLDEIYPDQCRVDQVDHTRIVTPKHLSKSLKKEKVNRHATQRHH